MNRELKKSRTNKVIGGVCGGLGEYFDIDPVFVRVVVVLLALGTHGVGVMAYIIAMIIMPSNEVEFHVNEKGETVPVEDAPREYSSWNKYLPGIILVCIGILWLVKVNFYWFDFEELWPLLLIIVGLFLVFRKKDSGKTDDTMNPNIDINGTKHENGGTTI